MESKTFPFIVYSHGAYGGGDIDYAAYIPLLESVASYGFIVAAPRSCSDCIYQYISIKYILLMILQLNNLQGISYG